MIVFGGTGHSATGDLVTFNSGGRYDPQTDTWTPLPTYGAPAVTAHVAVWTGTEMIVWGGRHLPGEDNVNTGARYNLAENKWYPISTPGNLTPRIYSGAVWSGKEMIVWGGMLTPANTCYNTGARYNPVTDTWTPLAPQNVPEARMFWRPDLGLWTGGGMLFYGGSVYPQEISSTALYVPERFAHGYQALRDDTETSYQVGEFYAPGVESGLMYNDPRLGLKWPLPVSIISEKDQVWKLLAEIEPEINKKMRI
jgi:hypothetical protein